MNIKTIENKCIKYMTEFLNNYIALGTDNVEELNQLDDKMCDFDFFGDKCISLLSEEDKQDNNKIQVVSYYLCLADFLYNVLPTEYRNTLAKYEHNLLIKINFIRDVIEDEKDFLQQEINNILLEKIKSNNTADIMKNNTIYTKDIVEEAKKNVQQKKYGGNTIIDLMQNKSVYSKCSICNTNMFFLSTNMACMQYLAQYFDNKYNIKTSLLLTESTVDKALKEAEKLLDQTINTSKNYKETEIYKILVELETASNIPIIEEERNFINDIIENSNKQYSLENGKEEYINPLEEKVQHRQVQSRSI